MSTIIEDHERIAKVHKNRGEKVRVVKVAAGWRIYTRWKGMPE